LWRGDNVDGKKKSDDEAKKKRQIRIDAKSYSCSQGGV
jgi:hypothetical protein